MRNQAFKQKHNCAIKHIAINVSPSSQNHNCNQSNPQDISFGRQANHHHQICQDENCHSNKGKNAFQTFMKSVPKYKSKVLCNHQPTSDQRHRETSQSRKKQVNFRKTNSFQENLNCMKMSKLSKNETHYKQVVKDQKYEGSKNMMKQRQLQEIQKRNEKNLILNIQKLRFNEKKYIKKQTENDLFNKLANAGDKSMLYNFIRKGKMKEFNTLQCINHELSEQKKNLKDKVLNKLSRRHVYHTLKHKSQVLHKVKAKSFHKQNNAEENVQEDLDPYFNKTIRVQYGGNQKNFKILQYKQLKIKSNFFETEEPLRINSKQAFFDYPQKGKEDKRNRKISQSDIRNKIKINTLGTLSTYYFNKQSEELDKYKTENQQFQLNMIRKKKPLRSKQNSAENEAKSMFRDLTPWHGGQLQRNDFSLD